MQRVNINMEQSWDTLEEAVSYFLNLVLDLKALQRLPNPPTDLFIHAIVGDEELQNKLYEQDVEIVLESL